MKSRDKRTGRHLGGRCARSKKTGFTLLEVLVATVIMGIAVAGLIAGLSQSVKNASRLNDYDRSAMLARTKMNDLLLDATLPLQGQTSGDFTLADSGGVPSGWHADLKPFDVPPHAGPGAVLLLMFPPPGVPVAMRVGFNTMDKTDQHLSRTRRVVNTRRIIESEIDGFVYSIANFYPAPTALTQVVFLQAEPQSMRFVTTYSLTEGWRGKPRLAELQVIPGDQGQGVRLILNETPYTGPLQTGQRVAGIEPDPS